MTNEHSAAHSVGPATLVLSMVVLSNTLTSQETRNSKRSFPTMFVIVWLLFSGQEIGSDVAIVLASDEARPGPPITVTGVTVETVLEAAVSSEDDEMAPKPIDAVLFKSADTYVAAYAVELSGGLESAKVVEGTRPVFVVCVIVWVV